MTETNVEKEIVGKLMYLPPVTELLSIASTHQILEGSGEPMDPYYPQW